MNKSLAIESTDINDVFPHKVCINLDRRPNRWEEAQKEFARHELTSVRRFSASDGNYLVVPSHWQESKGAYGCLLSHLRIVQEARERALPNILIFEDDVIFDSQFRDKFALYIRQLPRVWDMLFFGALHKEDPIQLSQNVYRVSQSYSTFAYALNHTIFDRFIASNQAARTAVDETNLAIQKTANCFCFMPHLAWVQPLYSDAQERYANHWYIRESLALAGNTVKGLVARAQLIFVFNNPKRSRAITDNLILLIRLHGKRLPAIRFSIVEQGVESTIDSCNLPENCEYYCVRDDGPFDRGMCFNRGVRESDSSREVFGFFDGGVFLESKDISGNIAMCRRYDCTTGFDRIFELTENNTESVLTDESMTLRWFDPSQYSATRKADDFSDCCFFDRQAFQAAGGWLEKLPEKLSLRRNLSSEGIPTRFHSPNHALRLRPRH